jgi:hypothetical protein
VVRRKTGIGNDDVLFDFVVRVLRFTSNCSRCIDIVTILGGYTSQ